MVRKIAEAASGNSAKIVSGGENASPIATPAAEPPDSVRPVIASRTGPCVRKRGRSAPA